MLKAYKTSGHERARAIAEAEAMQREEMMPTQWKNPMDLSLNDEDWLKAKILQGKRYRLLSSSHPKTYTKELDWDVRPLALQQETNRVGNLPSPGIDFYTGNELDRFVVSKI